MKRILITVAALAALALPAASSASALTCAAPFNGIWMMTLTGYARYIPASSPWWKYTRPTEPALALQAEQQNPPCGIVVGDVNAAVADGHRFFALLAVFPTHPTAKQWKAKYPALVKAALKTDQAYYNAVVHWASQYVSNGTPGEEGQLGLTLAEAIQQDSAGINVTTIQSDEQALSALLSRSV